MDAAQLLDVLARLEAAGVRTWLDGGWGVDALLRTQTRDHADADIVIARDDSTRAAEALAADGFAHDASADPGLPARLVLRAADGRSIDLHPIVFDERGNGWQQLSARGWGAYPAAGLEGNGEVGGRAVRCITADLQLRHHLGYDWGETDRADMAHLAARFGVALPPLSAE
ncbi:MAG: nucleotidyltransferase domain-containing protein [Tepidiformaceae bacterium]